MSETLTLGGKEEIGNLLEQVAEGDRIAFTRFFYHYYDQVYRFAYCFIQEEEGCREVVTDVFFSLWQSRKKLLSIKNLEIYLYVSVRNESARYFKRMKRYNHISLDEIPISLEGVVEESPESALETQELEALLAEVVSGLPEKCRQIFLMSREEGLQNKDIAEILSISENTVRVQLKIAVEKIMERMEPYLSTAKYVLIVSILKFF